MAALTLHAHSLHLHLHLHLHPLWNFCFCLMSESTATQRNAQPWWWCWARVQSWFEAHANTNRLWSLVVSGSWLKAAQSVTVTGIQELQRVFVSLQLFAGFFLKVNLATKRYSLFLSMYLLLQAKSCYLTCKGPVVYSVFETAASKCFTWMKLAAFPTISFRSNSINQTMPFSAGLACIASASFFCTCWDHLVTFLMNHE